VATYYDSSQSTPHYVDASGVNTDTAVPNCDQWTKISFIAYTGLVVAQSEQGPWAIKPIACNQEILPGGSNVTCCAP
jgi:hypothetical protein